MSRHPDRYSQTGAGRSLINRSCNWEASTVSTALILGGGAPNLTLMSGALAAFTEQRARFEVIGASGAGMLVGLLYATNLATKDRLIALENTRNMGVSDLIYDLVLVNYKIFEKPGILADVYRKAIAPFIDIFPQETLLDQLMHDWVR